MHSYSIANEDHRSIKDIDFYKDYIIVLYDKNEIAVYENKSMTFMLSIKHDAAG